MRAIWLASWLLAIGPTDPAADGSSREAARAPASPGSDARSLAGRFALDVTDYRLANGLRVLLLPDRRAPVVAVSVWYHVGSGDEERGKSGFAHLFEHMMFQGARHVGRDVHFEILRKVGASQVNGTTNSDRTNYFEVVPSHHLETALWLESDRMGYMLDVLDQSSLANQIDVVRNERRQRYDNAPYARERFAIAAALYPDGHPYRYLTIGRHEDLEAASLADVRAFFQRWYVPSNATLALAGDFELAQAKRLVDKWFGSFPALPAPARARLTLPPLPAEREYRVDDPFVRRPRLHWVWHAPETLGPDALELEAAAAVLGAGGWGRLHRRLVLGEALCVSANAYYAGGHHGGTFHVVTDLLPGADPGRVRELVELEVSRLIREPVAADELRRFAVARDTSYAWSVEDALGRAELAQWWAHYAGDPRAYVAWAERVWALGPGDVQRAAARWLDRGRIVVHTTPAAREAGGGGARP